MNGNCNNENHMNAVLSLLLSAPCTFRGPGKRGGWKQMRCSKTMRRDDMKRAIETYGEGGGEISSSDRDSSALEKSDSKKDSGKRQIFYHISIFFSLRGE